MPKIHIDVETRSRVDIWRTGAYVYAEDPSTELLCVAYAVDDGPVKVITYNDILAYPLVDGFEELRILVNQPNALLYCHNAIFEQFIFKFKIKEQFDFPRLPINKFRCTAAKALSHGLPKALADVAVALGATEKKDTAGRMIMLKMCKPKGNGVFEEDPELMKSLEDYCIQDVKTERAIDAMLPELSNTEQTVWFMDQLINQRGIYVDTEALDKCLAMIEEETELLKKEIVRLTDGKLSNVSQRAAVLKYFKQEGTVLPDFTKATVQAALDAGQVPPHLRKILLIRQQLGLTSTAKYKALKAAVSSDDRLRDTLIYHSASTGRWGGKIVQMQNLPRGTVKDTDSAIDIIKYGDIDSVRMMYGNVMGALSSCVRGMFTAPDGHDLIVADYAAIEARVLAWLAGQDDAVKVFAAGEDIYVKMAQVIYNDKTITAEDTEKRRLGKQAVLGCGYQMGAPRFKDTCRSYGIIVDDALAERAVGAYRKSFKKVVKYWYDQERTARTAMSCGVASLGNITWKMEGDFLYCTLPSGRRLAYHKPKLEGTQIKYMTTDSVTRKYMRKDTYGGKLVENITQAVARDLLARAMVKAEYAGYKIVLTVHDELVAEVPKDFGSVEEFCNIITETPEWAKGCPVAAEGWRGERYKK